MVIIEQDRVSSFISLSILMELVIRLRLYAMKMKPTSAEASFIDFLVMI